MCALIERATHFYLEKLEIYTGVECDIWRIHHCANDLPTNILIVKVADPLMPETPCSLLFQWDKLHQIIVAINQLNTPYSRNFKSLPNGGFGILIKGLQNIGACRVLS